MFLQLFDTCGVSVKSTVDGGRDDDDDDDVAGCPRKTLQGERVETEYIYGVEYNIKEKISVKHKATIIKKLALSLTCFLSHDTC